MKRIILHALRNHGYEIKKNKLPYIDYISEQNRKDTSGYYIEFLGVSGVGKSTLFRKVFESYRNDWYSRRDLAAIQYWHAPNPFDNVDQSSEFIYTRFYNDSLNRLMNNNSSLVKTVSIHQYFLRVIKNDAISRFNSISKGFFCDDGVLHNFSTSITKYYKSVKNTDKVYDENFKNFLDNRIVVYITASTDFIINNLKKRAREESKKLNNYYEEDHEKVKERINSASAK
ncbi:MAG: hypothetical protein EA359_08950 [Balneolaceae bacterium]|nr:MAG: hypothetical protein EA359_08950 [Balneolaceae bacterium]